MLLELHLSEFAAEDFHSFFFVLELGAFVLDGNDSIRREVGDADGGIGRVDALAAMAAGVINVDSEVLVVDFNVSVGFNNRKDFDERERSLAEVISIKRREADEAMDAVFGF